MGYGWGGFFIINFNKKLTEILFLLEESIIKIERVLDSENRMISISEEDKKDKNLLLINKFLVLKLLYPHIIDIFRTNLYLILLIHKIDYHYILKESLIGFDKRHLILYSIKIIENIEKELEKNKISFIKKICNKYGYFFLIKILIIIIIKKIIGIICLLNFFRKYIITIIEEYCINSIINSNH